MLDELLAALERSRIIRQTDDIIEVSHDQLAKRIAERRSADSKAIAQVQRLVRDRLASHQQTKTWLMREELAKVQPVLGQLGLSPAEADFVEKSRSKLRWRRVRLVGSTATLIAVLAGFGIYAGVQSDRAFNAISAASETTNFMAGTIVERLRGVPGTDPVQRELLGQLKALNVELQFLDSDATSDAAFWLEILEGDFATDGGEAAAARRHFDKARTDAEARLAARPDDPVWQRNVSIAAARLAALESDAGNRDAALLHGRRALAITEQLARAQPADSVAQRDLMISYGNLAGYERDVGDLAAARRLVTRALAMVARLEKAQPDQIDLQRDHGFYQGELGRIERDSGNFDAARTAFAAMVALYERIAAAEPESADRRRDLMFGYLDLADLERRAGRWDAAKAAVAGAAASLDPAEQGNDAVMLQAQQDAIARRDSRATIAASNPA
jgi:tetratricopeptide (TPR) repeat protein